MGLACFHQNCMSSKGETSEPGSSTAGSSAGPAIESGRATELAGSFTGVGSGTTGAGAGIDRTAAITRKW